MTSGSLLGAPRPEAAAARALARGGQRRTPEPRLPALLWLAFGKTRRVSAHAGYGPMAQHTITEKSRDQSDQRYDAGTHREADTRLGPQSHSKE